MAPQSVLERSDVLWKKSSPEGFESVHRPFETVTRLLPKGWTEQDGVRPMAVDTTWEKDQPIELRDGTIIYCDVFRPSSSDKKPVPALVAWGPFGKSSNGGSFWLLFISEFKSKSCAEFADSYLPARRLSLTQSHEIQSWHPEELDKRS